MQRSNPKTIMLFFPGPVGGAEKVVVEGYRALLTLSANIELWVVGENRAPHVLEEFRTLLGDLPVKVFFCNSILDLKLIRTLKASLKESPQAIIHAHGFKAAFYAYTCKVNHPLIITHHGKTAHTLKVRLYELMEEFIMKRASKVIAVSQQMKESLSHKKIDSITVENFLTLKPLPSLVQSFSPLKLLYVGRLSPEKGCLYLVEAMNSFSRDDIHLSIVGDGVERSQLELIATNKNIRFLGFRNDIAQLMNEHHALIMPSLREGMPLTLIEATCQGLPVIASQVGGIPELVQNKVNGILANPMNSLDLRDAILELSLNYASFKESAETLAPKFRERFSAATWAEKTYEIYKSLSH